MGPIDWREDGSIAFGDVEWASPLLGQKRLAQNAYFAMQESYNKSVGDLEDSDALDGEALQTLITSLTETWVRDVHAAIGTAGTLPKNVDEWPHWLAGLHGFRFGSMVLEHWGRYPFAWRTTGEGPTENAP